ncbi:nucleotidyltransferase family protein [Marine Group III euryarchaeote]|nr:nucleotidyltransferase family protein [Marine Group III euryarchaeote]|tara:strand:+ start:616 stop:1350 length:735 start_codon:yes stop_codon:yes gene_type:complete
MDAIILAGGFAKRMWPLTKNKPKQLLNLAGKPMLGYVIKSLNNLDFDRIIISVNSFFAPQFQEYLDSNVSAKNVELFVEDSDSEDQKLGALGALNLLFKNKNLRGPVFIAGGDNLSDFDLTKMVTVYNKFKADVIGLYDVENIELAKLYGIADLEDNRIVDFIEKPISPPSTLAATAYWLLSESGIANFFSYINEGGDRDAMGNFLAWNVKRNSVYSVSFKGNWYDIGSLDSYSEAQKWLERRP